MDGVIAPLVIIGMISAMVVFVASEEPAEAAPCDEPIVNEIACENSKPGTPSSVWDISGSGSSSIQGFATDISVDQAETVRFKIDTTASSYRLDIYRIGYYGGDGARLIDTVLPSDVTNQPNCLSDPSTGLVDCGNWSESASWSVPSDAVSGVYFAHAVRTDGNSGDSHIMFVVRDDDGGSDLLFQTSDATWQAYNSYGGNSLYTGSPAGRAYKVSYNRPFTTRDYAPEDWVFNAEYPMIRFLESNGYDVSYTTNVDSDRLGAELLEHDAFVSVGHDEYWSDQQRTNVEAARDAGVHLAFFSGNEVFWKTRWENSIDGSGTPYRTLVSYKETLAGAVIDPAHPVWTGTWRDARFSPPADGARPENELTGQIFLVNCCEIDMEVGAADGDMRFWRDTRVGDLSGSQTTTIGTDIIGYEWDEDLDNGFRPAGLFRVSETFGGNQEILYDEGSSFGPGSATHSMTMYRAPSGALVFGAGTVQWAWALDSNHDRGSAPADTAARQATVNLFADMGVQPATMQGGLVPAATSTDTTAPTSTITSPVDGTVVGLGSNVTVTGTTTDVGGRVGGMEISTDGGATWQRVDGRDSWSYAFAADQAGSVTIQTRAVDDSGNIETPSAGVTIVVGSDQECPCTIWTASDVPDRTDPDTSQIEVGTKFRAAEDGFITGLRFHKAPSNTGTHTGRLWTAAGALLGTVTFSNESASGWQQADFATPVPIGAGTTYVASYHAPNGQYSSSPGYFNGNSVTNGPLTALANGEDGGNGVYAYGPPGGFPDSTWQGEAYGVDVVFDVTAEDTRAPVVTDRGPAPDAVDVSVGVPVTVTFDEPVVESTIQIGLVPDGASAVAGAVTYDAGSRTATFTPSSPLPAGAVHDVTVSGVEDPSGNTMTPDSWSFTTAVADTAAPVIVGRTPGIGASGVSVDAPVTVTFDEPVVESTIQIGLVPDGASAVAGTTSYNATTRAATFTPSSPLANDTVHSVNVSGVEDPSGNTMSPTVWSYTTASPSSLGCPCTIWTASDVPGTPSAGDNGAVNLGVKFQATENGYITGIRFYKGTGNTGSHTGYLWTAAGTQLGSVTFTGETASGWQIATFASPVPVTAGTTYVASYHAPSGGYALDVNGLSSAVTNGPLTALASGASGGNGVYAYGSAGQFPGNTWNASNYYVDVVYDTTATDTTPPAIAARYPTTGAADVPIDVAITAAFTEPVVESSIAVTLTGPGGPVPFTTSYDGPTATLTVTPSSDLAEETPYTIAIADATDLAGNTIAPDSWSFTTVDLPPPPPTDGPGGPIAVVTSGGNPFSGYFAEILRAEGLNAFITLDVGDLTPSALTTFHTVIVGDIPLTAQHAADLTAWVESGGNLIASRPDSDLATLLGLAASGGGTLSEGYLAVAASAAAGAGIESTTMQYHGAADRYTLSGGASAIATLYSDATTPTANPAVTIREVGSNGGQAAAFTYDLARSIVYTRQGNPAWEGQERDFADGIIRSNDLFFGGAQSDWVDLSKVQIPQADEQQRLLANLIEVMNEDTMPIPRLWYFPDDHRAVVVATGDDHANQGTTGRFDTYLTADAPGCSAADWQCNRFSSYVYASTPIDDGTAAGYNAQDFEIGLHPENSCNNYGSQQELRATYGTNLATWNANFPSLPSPVSNRFHCLVWSDWDSQAIVEGENGMRLDVNYYYWPGSWVNDQPGFMTGSGMPQRFARTDGTMIDVYQAATQMTDESGQSYPFTPDTLLDRALGSEGYYGYFVANMHTDQPTTQQDTALLSSALARGVPVVSGRDVLEFIDGRNQSSFQNLVWSTDTLSFDMVVGAGAVNLTAMLPTSGPGGTVLTGITRGGSPVTYETSTIKGIEYATFDAVAGSHVATYAAPGGAPQVLLTGLSVDSDGSAEVEFRTDQPASVEVEVGTTPGGLTESVEVDGAAGDHSLELEGLEPGTTNYLRVTTTGPDGATATWPPASEPPAPLVVPAEDSTAPVIDDIVVSPQADGTAIVRWATDEDADATVTYGPVDQSAASITAYGTDGTTAHTAVLTGLEPDEEYVLVIRSTDSAGNRSTAVPRRMTASPAGVAEYMARSQSVGELSDGAVIAEDQAGIGHISVTGESGMFTSRPLDALKRVAWTTATWDVEGACRPQVSVRGGNNEDLDDTWSDWQLVAAGGAIDVESRFVQYRLALGPDCSGDANVYAVSISHGTGFVTVDQEGQDAGGP